MAASFPFSLAVSTASSAASLPGVQDATRLKRSGARLVKNSLLPHLQPPVEGKQASEVQLSPRPIYSSGYGIDRARVLLSRRRCSGPRSFLPFSSTPVS